MTKQCQICSKKAEKEGLCKDCRIVLGALYGTYDLFQLMTMFKHILGIKLVEDLTKTTTENLKTQNTDDTELN